MDIGVCGPGRSRRPSSMPEECVRDVVTLLSVATVSVQNLATDAVIADRRAQMEHRMKQARRAYVIGRWVQEHKPASKATWSNH
eukprot:14298902-Alexandrium_andersonii.AAC.1